MSKKEQTERAISRFFPCTAPWFVWAFGATQEVKDIWYERHGDIFRLTGDEDVWEINSKVRSAYEKRNT